MTTQAQSRFDIFELPLPAPAAGGSKASVAELRPSGQKLFARKLLAEPLFHFLLAGALILAGSSLLRWLKSGGNSQYHIVVSAAQIRQLQDVWVQQWGRQPDKKEMDNLINEYVREEVLYREALLSGLDKDDTIVRRRLVEKMEFLSQETASSSEPTDSDLQQFLQSNSQKYLIPARVSFSHIYFSTSKRGQAAEADAQKLLAALRSDKISASQASAQSDAFILQSEYPLQTENEIKDNFGSEFASEVAALQPGEWGGPFKSSYGVHLVRVLQRTAPRLPQFEEVRQQLTNDLKTQRLQAAADSYYDQLRQHYRVDVDSLTARESTAGNRP